MQKVKFNKDMAVSPSGSDTVKYKKGDEASLPEDLVESLLKDESVTEVADAPRRGGKKDDKSSGSAPENK